MFLKYILTSIVLMFGYILYAQVGINTKKPLDVFHIDPYNNTYGSSYYPVNDEDDVIFTTDGKLGIGTANPQNSIHIKTKGTSSNVISGFQLQDGSQGEGKVLVTDINGYARWGNTLQVTSNLLETPDFGPSIQFNNASYFPTSSYITIGPGMWVVSIISLISGLGNSINDQLPVWLSSTLTEKYVPSGGASLSSIKSDYIENNGSLISGNCWSGMFNVIMGNIIINNTSSNTLVFQYVVGGTSDSSASGSFYNVGGKNWGESNMTAYRVPTFNP